LLTSGSVNIGGWLVLEPFITPALYEPFNGSAVDEWTLSTLIQTRDGNLNAIQNHYDTFITEEDFAQIAAAGLNWVRIPLPFWAIEVYPGEPFLPKVSWTYFLKAIEWARKYGLRINLDLHTIPGSQNGWNHSGKTGEIDFLAGVMGVANAQRAMDYIRIIAEFISQPEYQPVVPFFGIINEPYSGDGGTIPETAIREFYAEAYRVLRNAGGVGNGNGPFMSIHEAYWGLEEWVGFLSGADRIALDTHPYLIFEVLTNTPVDQFAAEACNSWASMFTASSASFGLTAAGEWSFAVNDCGEYLNGVGEGTRYEGTFDGNPVVGSCEPWNDYTTWDASTIAGLKSLGEASMDALGNSFFWTWKIGVSGITGKIGSPMWSYQLAIEGGWALTDPRTSAGTCNSLGTGPGMNYTGPFLPNEVGGSTTVTVPSLDTFVWPPDSIGGYTSAAEAAELPRYTPTGPIPTLPIPTFTASGSTPTETANLGNGWNNASDTTLMAVPATGCDYPNPWAAVSATIPVCNVA
jgi:aryl-phospho-beta-D-glucosidase BglC (GH1 family)